MNREDRKVLVAVRQASPRIAWAVGLIVGAFRQGGRLIFVGAGTSGRLGVIEAAECPPTFNIKPGQVQAIMAGGEPAVFRSKEGAEDSEEEAMSACRRVGVGRKDVVVGVAASGVTPFVRAALRFARGRKARTVLVTCNPRFPRIAEVTIALRTGPEILAGSTRLNAGTACKMVLNMLTTASLVQMGKVYGNRMVDLQPKSHKLVERGVRLIRELGGVRDRDARRLMKEARGHVKTAIVMARKKLSRPRAQDALKRADGFLHRIF
jgi:N-acetylmuramic acid 6-phosphate etherase